MSSRPETPTLLGGVAASVAHELNNQLAILMGRAELLQEDLAGMPSLVDDARVIREAAAHSHRAAQALVGLVRPRPGERAALDLNEAVSAGAAMLAYTLRSGGVALDLTVDPTAPRVRAEAGALARLLLGALYLGQRAARQTAPARLQAHVSGATLWLGLPATTERERSELEALAREAGTALQWEAGGLRLQFTPA